MAINYGTYASPRVDLGNAVFEAILMQGMYKATEILPLMSAPRKAGTFPKIKRGQLLTSQTYHRAADGSYPRDHFAAADDTFSCTEYGDEILIDDSQAQFYKNDFDFKFAAAQKIGLALRIAQEVRAAAAVFNPTVWTGASLYTDVATVWSNTSADVKADVDAAKEAVLKNSGAPANAIVMNMATWNDVVNNDNIVGTLVVTDRTEQAIANAIAPILGLKYVIRCDAVYNTGGVLATPTHTGQFIWSSSYAMVCRIAETSDVTEPSIGRTFMWSDDSPTDFVVEEYRDETRRGNVLRVRQTVDEKIIDVASGHLLKID